MDGRTIRLLIRTHHETHRSFAHRSLSISSTRIIVASRRLALFLSLPLPPSSCPSVLSLLSLIPFFFFWSRGFSSPRFFSLARFSNKQKHEHGLSSGWRAARVERDSTVVRYSGGEPRDGSCRYVRKDINNSPRCRDNSNGALRPRNRPESSRVRDAPKIHFWGCLWQRDRCRVRILGERWGRENGARKNLGPFVTKATKYKGGDSSLSSSCEQPKLNFDELLNILRFADIFCNSTSNCFRFETSGEKIDERLNIPELRKISVSATFFRVSFRAETKGRGLRSKVGSRSELFLGSLQSKRRQEHPKRLLRSRARKSSRERDDCTKLKTRSRRPIITSIREGTREEGDGEEERGWTNSPIHPHKLHLI